MAKSKHFFRSRPGTVLLGALSIVAAWLVFLRASDTGSLQQYGVLIVLIIFGINRFIKAVFYKRNGQAKTS